MSIKSYISVPHIETSEQIYNININNVEQYFDMIHEENQFDLDGTYLSATVTPGGRCVTSFIAKQDMNVKLDFLDIPSTDVAQCLVYGNDALLFGLADFSTQGYAEIKDIKQGDKLTFRFITNESYDPSMDLCILVFKAVITTAITTGIVHKAKKYYYGIQSNVAKRVKKMYIGDENNQAQLCYTSTVNITIDVSSSYSRTATIKYAVTNPDGSTWNDSFSSSYSGSKTIQVDYGATIRFTSSINDSNSYNYSISPSSETITALADVTKTFSVSRSTIYYTVKFYDWDDTYLGSRSTTYGGSITSTPAVRGKTGYTFSSWAGPDVIDLTNVTKSGSVRASYTINKYTVTVNITTGYGDYGSLRCEYSAIHVPQASSYLSGVKNVSYNGSKYSFTVSGVEYNSTFYVEVYHFSTGDYIGYAQGVITSNKTLTVNIS